MPALAPTRTARALWALALTCAALPAAHAALFEDDEARRAILEMRQRVDALQQSGQRNSDDLRRSGEDTTQLRRSLLELQTQIETLRAETAKLRGQNEQLLRDVTELQRHQKDMAQGVDERLRQFEPAKVSVDGQEFQADPAEKRDFDAALAVFRSGKFADAQAAFGNFVRLYPRSGYVPSARFWLGNAQYATRDYKEAINNFKALLAAAPNHARAPEAALSIANCQIELKETRGARKTLEDLVRAYPQSEAAVAAKDRLSRLK
ncbi:tol-pal system protein YbgF [Acidovorax sp. SRB_14]|uniref:tol-pal system protein YbgF n=1 Tax=unclassified Acidovorax TaxID=2684926 RepID=UPI00145D0C92|nr:MULTISPECIES: tol-pal system protein YbgF [unclassified Acidovorax]NMM75771.1 tol-pal system protein YbgF [Acidovorax sp. SRB_24]NMM79612.1 tol-pal system protein YbgF [Acidovorax sp. SRB_14]NMM87093.1 tol-pal system protein YbgF [Rhodococcus sp. SRB_17]